MLALCRKATGDLPGAVSAFGQALDLAPGDIRLLGNYANLLCKLGMATKAIALYRQAVELAPDHGEGWVNLGLTLLEQGDAKAASVALERAVSLSPGSASAWHGLGAARRELQDLAGAETALRQAVALAPGAGAAWTSLGVVRRLLGDPEESLACYATARKAGFSGPELLDAETSAHLDLGLLPPALAAARSLVAASPDYVPGHEILAHILWEHGASLAPDEDPLAGFARAVQAQPANRPLRMAYVRFLVESGAAELALAQLGALRDEQDHPALVIAQARALELLARHDAAIQLLEKSYASMRGHAGYLSHYAMQLLKSGRADAAAARALEVLEYAAEDQLALACLGLAWRMLEDPREAWLCGYERLVMPIDVEPPDEFADEATFLAALEATLLPMHTASREPVNQSLRGGSQTSGVLFGRRDPVLASARAALGQAVMRYVDGLPVDSGHPFLRRKPAGIRFKGSWSVRLWSSGWHVNHFHQEGWISSAFYVSLPPSVSDASPGSSAGFIQFGQPPVELGLSLAPRRTIQPRAGSLVLFPSYLWHGTVPFADDAPRLTMAFDIVPA